MYRIHFDPTVSKFVVQFLVWGLFWKTCQGLDNELDLRPLYFETYADAAKWVSDKGIPEVYEVQAAKKTLYMQTRAA